MEEFYGASQLGNINDLDFYFTPNKKRKIVEDDTLLHKTKPKLSKSIDGERQKILSKILDCFITKEYFALSGINFDDEVKKAFYKHKDLSFNVRLEDFYSDSSYSYDFDSVTECLSQHSSRLIYYGFSIDRIYSGYKFDNYINYSTRLNKHACIERVYIPEDFDISKCKVIYSEVKNSRKLFTSPISEHHLNFFWNNGINPNNMTEEDVLFIETVGDNKN